MRLAFDISSIVWSCLLGGTDIEGKKVEFEGKSVQVNTAGYGYEKVINLMVSALQEVGITPMDCLLVPEGLNSKAPRLMIDKLYKAGRGRPQECYVEFQKLRDNLIEVLDSDYIRMAELKGLSRRRVLLRHALPNALVPTLNVTALNLAYLVVGVVVVEVVFVYPGMGQYMVDAVTVRDMPVVQACGLIFAAFYIFLNMFADILAIVANPRLRHPR